MLFIQINYRCLVFSGLFDDADFDSLCCDACVCSWSCLKADLRLSGRKVWFHNAQMCSCAADSCPTQNLHL